MVVYSFLREPKNSLEALSIWVVFINSGLHCRVLLENPYVNTFRSFLLDRSDSLENNFPKFYFGIGGLCLSRQSPRSWVWEEGWAWVWEGREKSKHSVCNILLPGKGSTDIVFHGFWLYPLGIPPYPLSLVASEMDT